MAKLKSEEDKANEECLILLDEDDLGDLDDGDCPSELSRGYSEPEEDIDLNSIS